jgi:hypothetical protein
MMSAEETAAAPVMPAAVAFSSLSKPFLDGMEKCF